MKTASETTNKNLGKQIVVADRGFVYVGDVKIEGNFVYMSNAKNIRYWGTTKGLGELVNGPTETTKLDDTGNIIFPMSSVIHFIECDASKWK